MNIAVLITCFNRKEKTVRSLQALKYQFAKTDYTYDIHLTDDGCTDGTAEAVLKESPEAIIYKGGNLYYAGGMRLCWAGAVKKGGYDYYLLLNDDTYVNDYLFPDFEGCRKFGGDNSLIIGNTCHPDTGEGTYYGVRITSYCPFKSVHVEPKGYPEYISYSGANIWFVPHVLVEKIGIFPKIYVHAVADNDYCLRTLRAGYKVIGTAHFCGYCIADHRGMTTDEMRNMSMKQRWLWLWSPKGAAMKQWLYFQCCFFPWRVPGVILRAIYNLIIGIGVR